MKEINISIKYDENEFNAEMGTKGFDEINERSNTLEVIGVLESLKLKEFNKLNSEVQDEQEK